MICTSTPTSTLVVGVPGIMMQEVIQVRKRYEYVSQYLQ